MEKLPSHCQENATFLQRNDYMNLEVISAGIKTSLKFIKVPDFYIVDDKECFAAEMRIEGLKVGTAALATENILNVKLHETEGFCRVRNLNFLIPPEANARKVSVIVFNENTVFMQAPVKRKHT